MYLHSEVKKPHCGSFTSLQISESFNHFRSVSYFEAVKNPSLSGSPNFGTNSREKPKAPMLISSSTPCTPKKIELEKYSTLPINNNISTAFPSKKTRSASLSSFFRKLKPRFQRSSSNGKNPWIVIEFAGGDNSSSSSDDSLEIAVRSKEEHFTSLKDLCGDNCNCALGKDQRKDSAVSTPKENFVPSPKFRSENSVFFRLSPRRRLENLKHVLRTLHKKKRRRCTNSASMHSLGRDFTFNSDCKLTVGCGQFENIGALPPVFHLCNQSKQEHLKNRHSVDVSYLLRIPNSRSSNTSLSSVLEDGASLRPQTLNVSGASDPQTVRLYQKMASVESIGACSLDLDASATESFAGKRDVTASAATLLSNGISPSLQEARNGDAYGDDDLSSLEQRYSRSAEKQLVGDIKLPSYLSISCAINGYTNYSRFCRSRDSSPAGLLSLRKSSLESAMPGEGTRDSFRNCRSQSDCNGTAMKSVFTESKRIFMGKQVHQTSSSSYHLRFSSTDANGHSLSKKTETATTRRSLDLDFDRHYPSTETDGHSPRGMMVPAERTNGHSHGPLSLSKEVGNGGAKSLVQQRIESLYGTCDTLKVKGSPKSKSVHQNGVESSITSIECDGSVAGPASPPVFRHLNKDFRKQLQVNIPAKKLNLKTSTASDKTAKVSSLKDGNGVLNGIGRDECDRVKCMTPPLLKSDPPFGETPKTPTGIIISQSPEEREGYKFLNLVDAERDKIQVEVLKLERDVSAEEGIPEEAMGKIRAACGKANLLMSQKFEQFRGLCWKNIEENPGVPFYTTESDLAGFWDLVMLQVDDIHATFREIYTIKDNGWKEVALEKPKTTPTRIRNPNIVSRSNPSTPKRSAKSAEMSKAREEARKQLLAAKKKGKQQHASSVDSADVEIFTPDSAS